MLVRALGTKAVFFATSRAGFGMYPSIVAPTLTRSLCRVSSGNDVNDVASSSR